MKTIVSIAATELRLLFYSPIAWVLLTLVYIQVGSWYFSNLENFLQLQETGGPAEIFLSNLTYTIFSSDSGGILVSMMQKLYMVIPLITMSLISRETSSGTIKLLYSSPIRSIDIVLGKYLAIALFCLLLVGITAIFMLLGVFHIDNIDAGVLPAAALGLFLLLCTYTAIGLYLSSLTSYQLVAALGAFAVIGALSFVQNLGQRNEFTRAITYYLSIGNRTGRMREGLIATNDCFYFLVIIFLFLSFTHFRILAGRESKPFIVKAGRIMIVIAIALTAGYISSYPAWRGYLDTTASKRNTLTPTTQQVIKKIGEPLNITAYNNVIGKFNYVAAPDNLSNLSASWDQYIRFKPALSFNIVNYVDMPLDQNFGQVYPGKNINQVLAETLPSYGIDKENILTPAEIRKKINLRPELNRLVMKVHSKHDSTFLRTFDDIGIMPGESEIAASLKRLTVPKQTVLFVTGHEERSIHRSRPQDYSRFASRKVQRYALINQGFDIDTISLDARDIPVTISLLVIADPKTMFSPMAIARLDSYIKSGGNLLLTTEPGRQPVMQPVLEKLGVRLAEGTLVQGGTAHLPDFIPAHPTAYAKKFKTAAGTVEKNFTGRREYTLDLQGATGIVPVDTSVFRFIPFAIADEAAWLKKGKIVTDSAAVSFDSLHGDEHLSFPVVAGLQRTIAGKQQRIVLCGDADFLGNNEFASLSVFPLNIVFGTGLVNWLDYEVFPVDVSRPIPTDNSIAIGFHALDVWKLLMLYGVPVVLAVMGMIILIRRKRK